MLGYSVEMQEIQALQTVHDILIHLLKPVSNASCQKGYEMTFADEKVRLCFPKLFSWLADHMENSTIHGIVNNRSSACICPTEKLGECSDMGYPFRSHTDYATAYENSDIVTLKAYGVKNINNALWSLPNLNPSSLVRVDILHNVLLGVLSHLMEWVQGYLKQHAGINAFDYVWSQLPPYTGFCAPKKAYRVVSQWSGKEMRWFGKIILGTFAAALRRNEGQPRPTGGLLQEFNKAIRYMGNLTDSYLMA